MAEAQIPLCPECGHPWVEHSKNSGCENEPFCWCHLVDPNASKAELEEFREGPEGGDG